MNAWVSTLHLVAVVLAGLQVVGGASPNSYVTQADYDSQTKASDKADTACASFPHGDWDEKKGRESLESGAGGNNPILQTLKTAKSQDDIGDAAREEINASEIGKKLLPLVLCFVMIFVWLICCWTACPFCRCCRCCAKVRETHMVVKVIGLIILGALAVGIVVCALLGVAGFRAGRDGMKDMECSASRFLNVTLAGQTTPPFIGLLPMLNTFASMEQSLEDGSQFVNDVNNELSNTDDIETANTFALQSLELLRDMMIESVNQRPIGAQNVDLLHKCEFCIQLAPVVDSTITALGGGLGKALQDARAEVQRQIAPSKRTDLRSSISESAKPLKNFKTSVRDPMDFFIDDDWFGRVNESMSGDTPLVLLGILVISFMAAFLMICACMGMCLFIVREKGDDASGNNPYCKSVHRCAGCTWCCAFFFAPLALFLGGLMIVVTFLLSSMCLIMDDIDGSMVRDIAPALGLSNTDDIVFNMSVNLIDQCLSVKDPNAAGNILNILYVNDNGQNVPMSTKFQDQTSTLINQAFGGIGAKVGQTISANPSAVQLIDILRNQDVDSMIVPDAPTMKADARFSAMDSPSSLVDAFVTSTKCADDNITQGLPNEGDTLKGISSFVSKLLTFGTGTGVAIGSCARKVVCTDTSNRECTAGNQFIDLKQTLLSSTTNRFRCDLFENPSNQLLTCDPKNMQGSGGGPYTGDCMFTSGTPMRRKEVSCSLPEFVTYVNEWSTRLDKAFARIDAASTATLDRINGTLKALVEENLVSPINKIVTGAGCGFLAQTYRGVVESLCYKGVYGLRAVGNSYAVLGILSIILILIMYMLWRRSIDNVNSWAKQRQ